MTITYETYQAGVESPARSGFAITPHASNALSVIPRAIYFGAGGTLTVRLVDDDTDITFTDVPQGTVLPIRAQYVRTTGSPPSSLIGLV